MAQPAHFIAAFVEASGHAELPGDHVEDVGLGAGFAQRLNCLPHGEDEVGALVTREIIALDRGCGRQHDIGPLRGRGEHWILDDDRLGARPGFRQAIQILMVMIGISSTHDGLEQEFKFFN